jgi:peptidoglycan/LPS O-acetylase OafA/YrhL
MATHDEFRYVIYDYAPAMFGVLILQAYAYFGRREASVKWITAGILVSFAAAGIQQSGFTLHQNFNYNDLYHVIQMGAIYLLYKGALLLNDQNEL